MKRLFIAVAALAVMLFAAPAQADPPEKGHICHGTGSESNPFVLLNVPLNSAHWTKHLPDGKDKVPFEVQGGFSCKSPDSDPDPPFTGRLIFTLTEAECPEGFVGVPGFIVTELIHVHSDLRAELVIDGEVVEEEIFAYPFTCIPVIPGPQGPAGPAGPQGLAGLPGVQGLSGPKGTNTGTTCTSKRVARWVLVVRRGKRITGFRALTEGVPAAFLKGRTRGGRVKYTVIVNLRGLTKTVPYVARVRYRINGVRNTKIHLFRTCIGNPKGGLGEHMNRFAITLI